MRVLSAQHEPLDQFQRWVEGWVLPAPFFLQIENIEYVAERLRACRMHGARRPETVRRGANHPQYRQGREALEAKGERSRGLAELWDLAALSFALELATGPRWRGRKPIFEKACK